jgi:hypothetical protein
MGGNIIREVTGDRIVFAGAQVRFSLAFHFGVSSRVTYQWQRATPEMDWADLAGATGPVLEFGPVNPEAAGTYRVRVDLCWDMEEISDPIVLEVLATPPFSNPRIDPSTGAFKVTFQAEPFYSYAIERSSDLLHWTHFSTLSNPTQAVEITALEVPESHQQFYRARVLTP